MKDNTTVKEPRYSIGDIINYKTIVCKKRLTGRIIRVDYIEADGIYVYDIMNDGNDSVLLVTRPENSLVLISIDFTELLAI